MGEVQLKLWGRKPRRKAARKRPRTKPTGIYREPGHWSYSFVPPSEDEWKALEESQAFEVPPRTREE